MKLNTKKKFSYFVIGLLFFLGGVEYAVILPTAWFYLQQRFNAPSYMLGILISAFSFSGLFAGPLMGRWSDKVGKTRTIFLIANLFEIGGNIMYFFGISSWFLVAGRFVAGIGAGVGAPVIADIARVTTSKERTAVMSLFMAVRQFGLIIGPGFNLFLRKINFTVGDVIIDKYSAPGAFMAILWTVLEILVLLLYWDLPTLHRAIVRQTMDYTYRQDSESQFLPPPTPNPSIIPPTEDQDTSPGDQDSDGIFTNADNIPQRQSPPEAVPKPKPRRYPSLDWQLTSSSEMIESAERFMVAGSPDSGPIMFSATPQDDLSPIATRQSPDTTTNVANGIGGGYGANAYSTPTDRPPSRLRQVLDDDESYIQQQPREEGVISASGERRRSTSSLDLSWSYYYEEYMREEIIAILAVVFIAFFNQTAMEAMITPLTDSLLDWDEFEVSLLYCGAGVEIILVFFLITFLSRRFHDRYLLLTGYLIVTVTIAALLWYLPNAPPHQMAHNLPFFISGVVLDVFGLPFLVVTSTSLYSKVTREQTQGVSQGLRGVCGGIGTLLGPLWADSLISHLYLMLGVMLGLMCIALVMLLLSFKHMQERSDALTASSSHSVQAEHNNEREPLIRANRP